MTELLTVRGVRKSFGDHLVLRDISFDVPHGQQLGHRATYLPSLVSSLPCTSERISQMIQ